MQTNNQIWVVDDDKSIRWVLEKALQKADYEVVSFSDADAVVRALELISACQVWTASNY